MSEIFWGLLWDTTFSIAHVRRVVAGEGFADWCVAHGVFGCDDGSETALAGLSIDDVKPYLTVMPAPYSIPTTNTPVWPLSDAQVEALLTLANERKAQREAADLAAQQARAAELAAYEARKQDYKPVKVYRHTEPRGQRQDGYRDADWLCQASGEVVRMVERDVFDVGCYAYPKRVEGTDAVNDRASWTAPELAVADWFRIYGVWHGIRM